MVDLLKEMVARGASDLHLTVKAPPMFRIDGELVPTSHEVLSPEMIEQLVCSVLTAQQKKKFEMEE